MSRPSLPRRVQVVEVGPRDGLQNESTRIATADKIRFIDALSAAGLPVVEITSFVNPKWVPQLDDAEAVASGIARKSGTRYSALVPNIAGLERALGVELEEVGDFRRSIRILQPAQHQHVHRRIIDAVRRGGDARTRSRHPDARVPLHVVRLSV